MTFTLHISTDSKRKDIKEKCLEVLAELLKKEGYFSVGSAQDQWELVKEPVSGLDNCDMPIERWKQAVKAASNQRNYRSSKGLTETRDDYFVDGVQWADEHPKEEPVSDELETASRNAVEIAREEMLNEICK